MSVSPPPTTRERVVKRNGKVLSKQNIAFARVMANWVGGYPEVRRLPSVRADRLGAALRANDHHMTSSSASTLIYVALHPEKTDEILDALDLDWRRYPVGEMRQYYYDRAEWLGRAIRVVNGEEQC